MPPQECRQHALDCVELAEHATTPKARQIFLDLSETWLRLARELDGAQGFLNVLNGAEVNRQAVSKCRRRHNYALTER
jgi:hypothetical protein